MLEVCLQRSKRALEKRRASGAPTLVAAAPATGGEASLLEISALRNRLEPLLRRFIKRTLKAHLGPEKWISPILKVVPSKDREKLDGVDRDQILNERLFLLNLITVVEQNWEYFKTLEACPPDKQVTKDQFKVLLTFVNAHREDAHAKPTSDSEIAALKIAVNAIEAAISYLLED